MIRLEKKTDLHPEDIYNSNSFELNRLISSKSLEI